MNSLLTRIYGGLSSLKLTFVVLSVLAVALIYGTFYESSNGTPMAHRYVYASKWFDAILITLFVNMMACTAKRYPYKPHQLGFLMVHCGILTILTGAMLTRNFGRDGEVFVGEGESRDFMTSTQAYLRVSVPQDGVTGQQVPVVFPAKAEGAVVDREMRVAHSPIRLHFSRFYPNARWRDTVGEGTQENPALHVRWSQQDMPGEAWLLPREAGRQAVEDPLRIEALEARDGRGVDSLLAPLEKPPAAGRGQLRLRQGGSVLASIPLDGDIPRRVQAGPYRVQLREWYSNFRIQDGQPVNASAAMSNPALVFDLEGPRGAEHHVVFAFHEMNSLIQPEKGLEYDVEADYAFAGASAGAPRVMFVRGPDGAWRIAANFDLDVPADHRLEVGRPYHGRNGAVRTDRGGGARACRVTQRTLQRRPPGAESRGLGQRRRRGRPYRTSVARLR